MLGKWSKSFDSESGAQGAVSGGQLNITADSINRFKP
jgi:hypothetical protein